MKRITKAALAAALKDCLLYEPDGTSHLWSCSLFGRSYGLKWCTCGEHRKVLEAIVKE